MCTSAGIPGYTTLVYARGYTGRWERMGVSANMRSRVCGYGRCVPMITPVGVRGRRARLVCTCASGMHRYGQYARMIAPAGLCIWHMRPVYVAGLRAWVCGQVGACGKSTPLQGCGTVAKQCARVVEKDMEKGVVIDTQTPVVIIL